MGAHDSEMMVQLHLKEKEKYAAKLHELFLEADVSGDGVLSSDEVHNILETDKARAYFNVLELNVHEVASLFNLLDDGDGYIDIDEFITGCMRLKGSARSQDVIAILHANNKLYSMFLENQAEVHATRDICKELARKLLPKSDPKEAR